MPGTVRRVGRIAEGRAMFKIVAMVVLALVAWSYIRKAMASLGDSTDTPDDLASPVQTRIEPEDIHLPK